MLRSRRSGTRAKQRAGGRRAAQPTTRLIASAVLVCGLLLLGADVVILRKPVGNPITYACVCLWFAVAGVGAIAAGWNGLRGGRVALRGWPASGVVLTYALCAPVGFFERISGTVPAWVRIVIYVLFATGGFFAARSARVHGFPRHARPDPRARFG